MPRPVRRAAAAAIITQAGLLDDLEGTARRRRSALLAALYDDGMTIFELRQAVEDRRLVTAALHRALEPERPRHTLNDIADRTSVDVARIARWFRAFERPVTDDPEARIYSDEDLDVARRLDDYHRLGLTEQEILPVARAVGRGLTGMADAIADILGSRFLVEEPDPGEALDYGIEIRRIAQRDGLHLAHLLSRSLAERIGSHVVAAADATSGARAGMRTVAVGFADIVGFTALGEQLSATELCDLADHLAASTHEVLTPPVRLSKTIGDAVMLVSPDPNALVGVCLALARVWHSSAEPSRPALRIGLAWGTAIPHGGDWFGSPVNLASRITAAARPGTILADDDLRDACSPGDGGAAVWTPAFRRRLKGFPQRRQLHRVDRKPVG
ncbi:adenylate/guanylate cyclase domain-containing protein [Actinomycetospora sp.]|jgi:adenylate cyclase|uniref:adenylate/guanylate cyclase domain-containing protein n=1 Tax=Actinomycetospora sp. TaxID=1872135 RepID=UPI002F4083A5